MCGRFSFHTLEKLRKIIKLLEEEQLTNLSGNIPPFTDICTIYNNSDNVSAIRNMYWQLIPDFCKEFKSKYSMFNTRAETLFEKKFKKDLILSRRCLIPVNNYYEWKKDGRQKTPYSFQIRDKDITFLGGIYSIWQNPHNLVQRYSCSIITTEAVPEVRHIHNRMPLIIDGYKTEQWLDKAYTDSNKISKMLTPYETNNLVYEEISSIPN